MTSIRLRGKGVSPGIGEGELALGESALFTVRRESISAASVEGELRRLRKAVERTRNELVRLKQEMKRNMGEEHAFIFDAHLLILGDRSLFDSIEQTGREEKVRAERDLTQVTQKYQELFDAIADEYFRQRKSDVSDVLARIAANLKRKKKSRTRKGQAKSEVRVVHEILPPVCVRRS